ncbi:MAG: helix-turn-helix transcriptional regulator [Myxococcales bacterium]|nr:helix-turn-helix transcriptional regulator [Myxococcales bacterium]
MRSPASVGYQVPNDREIRALLLRRGLSVRQVAQDLSISPQYLYDILKNRRQAKQVRERLVSEIGIPRSLVAFEERRAA